MKEFDGVLVHNISELEIKCLPADLVGEIEVDVSQLDTFDEVVTISDLNISKDIEIIGHEPADVVAIVARPREEEKEEVAAEQPAAEATAAAGGEKAEEERESETK
ncbi:MAG: hypothetical protein A3B89_01110 [Candidatus Buchananbacteria bacterium RIFCSPHIGHO2_02_FULL_40_13]|nr:MAG: hypothetical protein A3B89_01110 [Candidatus Buchananbacteria bacterium RIFCSPHIGHO2_02_FULL_40_13]